MTSRKLIYLLQKLKEFSRYCSTLNRNSIFYFEFIIISTCIHSYLRHNWRMTKWDTIQMTESLVYWQELTTIKCLFFIFRCPVLLYFEAKQNFNFITSSSERASMLHHKMFWTYIKFLCTVFTSIFSKKMKLQIKSIITYAKKMGFMCIYKWNIWNKPK